MLEVRLVELAKIQNKNQTIKVKSFFLNQK